MGNNFDIFFTEEAYSTVGINLRLSDLKEPETSKLDWGYLEHNIIVRNELQIRTNSQKGTGTNWLKN